MEVFTLDPLLRRTEVIDYFESLIWTDRYSAIGDFEMVIQATNESRNLLRANTRLAINESYRVMTVETVEDKLDSEGRSMLKVSGRSLESLLDDRSARPSAANLSTLPKWVLTGTPAAIARQIFDTVCVQGAFDPADVIPFLVTGSMFPPDTIAEPTSIITLEIDLGSVYKVIKEICDNYGLGFRLVRNGDASQLFFHIYTGSDRTTAQDDVSAVIFSPNLDTLTDSSQLTSVEQFKNVAYVYHPYRVEVVYAVGYESVTGFDRRVLTIKADDVVYARPYAVTDAQQQSIRAAQNLTTSLQPQQDALNKLLSKVRLTTDDVTVLTAVAGSTSLTTAQRTDISTAITTSTNENAAEDTYLSAALKQRGMEELSKQKSISAIDGEVPQFSRYKYQVDYNLGDLTEMRSADGVTNLMRVTEHIFASDAQGDRSYPTLVNDQFITPGSWSAWDYNQTWFDLDGSPKDWATS